MRIEPESSGAGVVLLGSFNPAIFTPAWFAQHGLLPKSVADNAELQIAHGQLTAFSAEWLQLAVDPERFRAWTRQEPYVRLLDLVMRVFGEHLSDTPVRAFGIDRDVHFPAPDPAARDRVGRLLVPTEPWGKVAEILELDGESGGMASLAIGQSRPKGRPLGGRIDVKVEPSPQIDAARSGICVQINDHHAVDADAPDGRERLFELLGNDFEASIRRADDIIDHVMSLAQDPHGGRSTASSDKDASMPLGTSSTGIDPEFGHEVTVKLADKLVERARARDRVASTGNSGAGTATDTSRSPIGAANNADGIGILNFPPTRKPARPTATLHALQEWEGHVVEIGDDTFEARLIDLTAGRSHESEEATIPKEELSDHDVALMAAGDIAVGSIFRWVIGYERSPAGTKTRVSRICFRDMPRVTKADLRKGQEWARKTASAFGR